MMRLVRLQCDLFFYIVIIIVRASLVSSVINSILEWSSFDLYICRFNFCAFYSPFKHSYLMVFLLRTIKILNARIELTNCVQRGHKTKQQFITLPSTWSARITADDLDAYRIWRNGLWTTDFLSFYLHWI